MEQTVIVNYKKLKSKKIETFNAAVREARANHYIIVEFENIKYRLPADPEKKSCYRSKVLSALEMWVEDYEIDRDFKISPSNKTTTTVARKSRSGLPNK